jgi:quercetin dioxygenase-like cupin family protein
MKKCDVVFCVALHYCFGNNRKSSIMFLKLKMEKKKNFFVSAIAVIGLAILITPYSAMTQQSGIKRTELQRYDLSTKGKEVIQVRIDFDAGTAFGNHKHPGEEVIYVIEGLLEYKVEGKPAVTLKAGDVLFIPAGTIHSAKNVGNGNGAELATYIVKKGKPVVVMTE